MKALRLQLEEGRADARKLKQAAARLSDGGVAVLPTDTNYALAGPLGDRTGLERIRQLRSLDARHLFTFLGAGFEELGRYAVVDNDHFRMLKSLIPGPYVFVLKATGLVPKSFAAPGRRTIGFRVAASPVLAGFIGQLGRPLLSCTLFEPNGRQPVRNLAGMEKWLDRVADLVLDVGELPGGDASVVDFSGDQVQILRSGAGIENLQGGADG